uniref:DDT domain-containing protein n=1 Tax=Globodera pallida TaxID=36090 RepID=A0A183CGG8_GLOPA
MASHTQDLDECLQDKSSGNEAFLKSPDFAETVAFLHQFGALFELTPFGYADLAQALHELRPAAQGIRAVQQNFAQNQLLDNLFAEILHYCGFKFDRSTLGKCVHKLIRRVNRWTVTPFDADLLCRNSPNEMEEEKQTAPVVDHTSDDHQTGVQSETAATDQQKELKKEEEEAENENDPQLQQQQSMNDLPTMDDDDDLPDENSPETGQSEPALSNLSASHVLRLIALLLDYLLQCVHEDGGLDPKFSDEQMHLRPLCVDPSGRKFWHFKNDTWLFMEEGSPGWMDEEKTQKEAHIDAKKESKSTTTKRKRERHIRTIYDKRKRKKGKKEQKKATEEKEQYTKRNRRNDQKRMEEKEKNITRQEVDEACKNLFTGTHLRAYRAQPTDVKAHEAVADRLEQCLEQVRNIEQERRRKAAERERERWTMARVSTRVVALMEKRQLEAEKMRARRQEMLAEKRRIAAEEEMALLREHRCLTDSDLRLNISREERHRLRQQRVDEQRERAQLVEAGLLEHDGDEHEQHHEEENDDVDEEDEEWWKNVVDDQNGQHKKQRRRLLPISRPIRVRTSQCRVWRWAREAPVASKIEDEEWWKNVVDDQNGQHKKQRRRLLPISRPIRVRTSQCRVWRWAREAPVASKIANFAKRHPSSVASSSTTAPEWGSGTTTTGSCSSNNGAASSSFCLLMDEHQIPAAVKRKMSTFFSDCTASSSSPFTTATTSATSAAFSMFNNGANLPDKQRFRTRTAAQLSNVWGEKEGKTFFAPSSVTASTTNTHSAISSIRSVLQLPGGKW